MSEFLDELARALVRPMPRSRALRLLGGALVGIVLPAARAGAARATHDCPAQGEILCQCPAANGLFYKLCCWSKEACTCDIPRQATCCTKPKVWDGSKCVGSCPEEAKCGSTCCKEGDCCCDRIFTFKDPYCCDCKDADKGACYDMKVAWAALGIAAGVVASLATGGLAAAFIGAGAAAGVVSLVADICEKDPPDPRYKELFRPRVPRVASVRPGSGISPAAARALNNMIANRIRAGAYALAWIRSIEKAQGADKAGDKTWARRQRTAAAGYARQAATILERDKSLSSVALRELQSGGFADTGVTLAQAQQWQKRVRQQGLPAETTRVLRAAGAEDARIAAYRTAVSRLDPKLVAGVGVFGNLTDQRLAGANAKMIKALRESARTLGKA